MITFLIKQKRIEKKLSITELARLSGVSKSFISRIESKERIPGVEVLCYLALALECQVSDLYEFNL